MKKILFFIIVMIFTINFSILSEEAQAEDNDVSSPYTLGDKVFDVSLSLFIPLFYVNPNNGDTIDTNLTVGANGLLGWHTYINPTMSLGFNFSGMFALTPNRTLAMFPFTGQYTYLIYKYPFEIPLFVRAGVIFTKLGGDLFVGPFLQPGAGFIYNINTDWGIGLKANYWWVPLWSEESDKNRFGNFLDIAISGQYHF